MKRNIAVLAVAIGFLVAPALGVLALDSCTPCCPQVATAPCESGAVPCAELAAASCCEVSPAVPIAPAKRAIEAPNFQPLAVTQREVPLDVERAQPTRNSGRVLLQTSRQRLSVVLLI